MNKCEKIIQTVEVISGEFLKRLLSRILLERLDYKSEFLIPQTSIWYDF